MTERMHYIPFGRIVPTQIKGFECPRCGQCRSTRGLLDVHFEHCYGTKMDSDDYFNLLVARHFEKHDIDEADPLMVALEWWEEMTQRDQYDWYSIDY